MLLRASFALGNSHDLEPASVGARLRIPPPRTADRAPRIPEGEILVKRLAQSCSMLAALALFGLALPAAAQEKKPNILIIWGDDIGQFNISAYNMGMMGYKTPNIDSLAKDGAVFTDWYGQQSCTAGRAAFITGQSPIRTGLTKVGLPGAREGLTKDDPTLAELLKPHGYATGQFGKNHLGDRNDMLPTVHGFDEWLGNLYHLNAEEEPENVDYPKDPAFKAKFGPRGVMHCYASDKDDPTVDPRFGKVGKQKCEDTGPLTRKRMETVDEEVTDAALTFMDKTVKDGKPFFVWWNSSRMHVFTHLKKESAGKTGLGIYADGMVEHDAMVGKLLAKLEELGVEDNTIVMYSTDNGAEFFNWPDGGTTMFRGEKNTQWEGGFRVPTLIRWPGVTKPGTVINDMGAHEDMIPTLLAAVGDTTVKEDLLKGRKIGGTAYKVHLDGYNLLPFLKGDVKNSPRREFIYWTDGGSVAALRYDDWKISFLRQNSVGIKVWETPFEELRWPMLTNLRMDPFERAADESTGHPQWAAERMFALAPAGAFVGQWLQSFREFPPRMKPGSFSLDRVMESVTALQKGSN
jgi:arylsulfatase